MLLVALLSVAFLPWLPSVRPPEAFLLRDAITSNDANANLEALAAACMRACVPFRGGLLGDGKLW